ncbi:hypothetical protein [Reinekea blandensis]|uniref:hypothetical protein n=1 Tax=Reinekea blandensis TaxID=374838 RepID=UPI000326C975|nr:hypothetical protein [Reinekea blandensis]
MDRLFAFSNWKKAGVFLAVNFFVQAIIVWIIYPQISPTLQPLDVRVGLTPETIAQFLSDIGSAGRDLYFINEATLDMLFPLIYSFAYALLLIELLKANELHHSLARYWVLVPLGIGLCDVSENLFLLSTIHSFPDQNSLVAQGLGIANMAKHGLTIVGIGLIFFYAGRLVLVKKRRP